MTQVNRNTIGGQESYGEQEDCDLANIDGHCKNLDVELTRVRYFGLAKSGILPSDPDPLLE